MNNIPRLSTLPKFSLNSLALTFHSIRSPLFCIPSSLFNLLWFLSPPMHPPSVREERIRGFNRQIDDLINDFRAEQWDAHEHALARNPDFNEVPSHAGFPMPGAHRIGFDNEVELSTSFDGDSNSESSEHEETYNYSRPFLEGNLLARPFSVTIGLRPIMERSPIIARSPITEPRNQEGRELQEQIRQARDEQERRLCVEGRPAIWSRVTPPESTYGPLTFMSGLRIWFLGWDNWQKVLMHEWERRTPMGDWDFWQRRLAGDEEVQEQERRGLRLIELLFAAQEMRRLMGVDMPSLSVSTPSTLQLDENEVIAARDGIILAQELLRLATEREERMQAEVERLEQEQEEENRRMAELAELERQDRLNQESENRLMAGLQMLEEILRQLKEGGLEGARLDELEGELINLERELAANIERLDWDENEGNDEAPGGEDQETTDRIMAALDKIEEIKRQVEEEGPIVEGG